MNSITDLLHSENEYYDSQFTPGFVQGVVVENNNGEFKGMVKVEFTVWEKGKNLCEWVRLISPYTGADYGTYFVPEIDEIVLVGFIGGSLKRPFLLGSLYPSGAEIVNKNFHEKNETKNLKTKGGMDILIVEEPEKQSIKITTPKGSVFVIEDEKETCLFSDKNGENKMLLDYKQGEVLIEAKKKITLKTGKAELIMEGEAGKYSVKSEMLELNGKNSLKAETTNSAVIKGATVSVEASGQLKVKSSGMAEISGSMVKIN